MSVFTDFSARTGMFRCRVTGNPCGSDTTLRVSDEHERLLSAIRWAQVGEKEK